MAELVYNEKGRLLFTEEMRKDYTILIPEMSPIHFQFVETARKLAVHTRKCCLKMPKRYTFYGAQELSALADTVYNEVKMANSVFPGNQHEAQLRRDHLIEANATLQALIGQLGIMADLLKQNPEKLRWLDNSLEEWASLISEEAKLISGVKKSDKERFKNLP